MRCGRTVITALMITASVATAKADTFGFTYTQGNQDGLYISITGMLSASATSTPGQYTITGATGTEVFSIGGTPSTSNITGVPSPDTAYGADDLLYTGGLAPYLDEYGFTFTTDGSGSDFNGDVNIAYLSSQGVYTTPYEIGTQNGVFALTDIPETDVPEPGTLSMSLGFFGLGFVLRRPHSRA